MCIKKCKTCGHTVVFHQYGNVAEWMHSSRAAMERDGILPHPVSID